MAKKTQTQTPAATPDVNYAVEVLEFLANVDVAKIPQTLKPVVKRSALDLNKAIRTS